MTTEPRQEAEHIVTDFALRCNGASGRTEAQARLVYALAAAFEWRELIHRSMDEDEEFVYHSMTSADITLLQALSALREHG